MTVLTKRLRRLPAACEPTAGFRGHVDFLEAVAEAAITRRVDPRLQPLAVAGSDEQGTYSDPAGGFLVPSAFGPNLLAVGADVDPVSARVQPLTMGAPTVKIPARVDKNHATSVSGGLVLTRRPETLSASAVRAQYEQIELRASTLLGFSYASDELVTDSFQTYLEILAAGYREEKAARLMEERLYGNGAGEFLDVLNAPCTIEVAPEGGQTADTIDVANVRKMRKRCWRYSQAIWLANPDTQTELEELGHPVYQYAQTEDAPDMLLGRPVFYHESCAALGDRGDLVLGVWSQYLEATLQPLLGASSAYVRFEESETAFKFFTRNDGQPWWRTALTPKRGVNTLSPFVVLGAR